MKNYGKLTALIAALALSIGPTISFVHAQTGGSASAQDKQFLHDLGEDSDFEMASARLALRKTSSADVKAYAQMVLTDHRRLQQETSSAAHAVQVTPVSSGSMSVSEHATLLKFKVLSGTTFDESYIKGLISGNEDIEKQEKAEASDSSIPLIKKLAEHSAAIDTKHANKAKELAAAHHIQA